MLSEQSGSFFDDVCENDEQEFAKENRYRRSAAAGESFPEELSRQKMKRQVSRASAGNDCRFLHQPEGWFSFVPAGRWRKLPAERMTLL